MSTRSILPASLALATAFCLATPAMAFRDGGGNGNSFGESLYGDLQKNPALIEPGAQRQRYLEYYGGPGWDRRQSAYDGYYGYPAYRSNVRVRPYRGYPY